MTIAADELAIMRANTTEFIAADSKSITLSRRTETPNGSGGFEIVYQPMVFPQVFRLIPQQGNMSPLRTTLDGEAVQPDYVLLGAYDVNLARWDTFTDQGRRYIVLFVHEKRSYEVKGEVLYLGDTA
jgi:hypothetical protein